MGGRSITVHVVLPAYRPDQRWLELQLRTILAQAGVPVRVWLCPDGPDAAVSKVVDAIGDDRITLLSFETRVGVSANVQRGVEAALAASNPDDLFAFADQDDVWHTEKLAKGAAALPAEPIALTFHDARIIDADGKVLAPSMRAFEMRHAYLDQLGLLIANSISGMTMMATPAALRHALPFPGDLPDLLHDWWLALVVSGLGTIARIDEPLLDYRQHAGNVIGAKAPKASPLISIPPRRIFLGRKYRELARNAFADRRSIALRLADRNALAPATADFFLHRRLRGVVRPWHGGARRYVARLAIGMLLTADGTSTSEIAAG